MSAPDSASVLAADAPWPELDRRFLRMDRRSAPPPFPLDVIPAAWRPWIEGHAQAALCADYIAQGLLAAVSAVCGSRFVVDVTPHWREPLVLWQLLVGAPSTGKTPAMAAAQRLLAGVKAPPDDALLDDTPPRRGEPVLTPWLFHRGLSRWNDESDWLAELSRDGDNRATVLGGWTGDPAHRKDLLDVGATIPRWAQSIFGTLHADRLPQTLTDIDDGLLSRFLYCWPVPRLEARLDRVAAGEGVRLLLQRLVDLPGTRDEPAALALHDAAAGRLQDLLPPLRSFMRDTDGLEAAWIGKAVGTIVRLAGLLALMDWAAAGGEAPCTAVEERHLERAHALWSDYYWPHAQAVFGQAATTLAERRVRRVGNWLRRTRPRTISREEIRRDALGQRLDADTADGLLERLEQYGAVRMLPLPPDRGAGRPRRRWEVNPELWSN